MPTQEEINAANRDLSIANENWGYINSQLNKYNQAFEIYANATPEQQARASGLMQQLLQEYDRLKLQRLAYEDVINVAQNRVNELNAAAVQPVANVKRRVVNPTAVPFVEKTVLEEIQPVVAEKPLAEPVVEAVKETPQRHYYDEYMQMKSSGAPSVQVAQWFRDTLGKADNRNAYTIRQDLLNRGLSNQAINDFTQDWGNATLASLDAQRNLASPQRIKTYGYDGSYPRNVNTLGYVDPNDPRLLTNR